MTSLTLVFGVVCGLLTPLTTHPVETHAADSVYDFDYGEGISWEPEDELPSFAPVTATEDNPMDAFVAYTDDTYKKDNTDQEPSAIPVKYAMVSLQGIVNRTRPQILIQESREESKGQHGDVWPSELIGKDNYKKTTNYIELINKYKDEYVEGLVVYNSDISATRNVATSIAGAMNYLAVDSTLAKELEKKCDLKVKIDLNKISSIKDKLSAYEYLYKEYYSKGLLNKRLLMGLDPDAHFPYNRDLAVATKSAVFWLEPNDSQDRKVLDMFFDEATSGVTYNLGWWPNEDSGICYATQKGVASVPSDWFENMTVYMAGEKKFDIPPVPAKPELENKIYVALAVSDGDNAAYNEHAMRVKWEDENRQTYPISWTTSPSLYYVAPQMMNYYHKTAGKDMLICGPSGMGYTKTTRWREETGTKAGFFEKNMASTEKLFEKTGLNIVTLWDRISEDCYEEYTSNMNCLLGVTINNNGFNDTDKNNADSMYPNGNFAYYPAWGELKYKNDTPIIGLGFPFGYCSDDDGVAQEKIYNELASIANNFKGNHPEFKFVQFVTWVADPTSINKVADELNKNYPGKFEFVRADHLFMLANEYNNVPYNLALQQKATASNTDKDCDALNAIDGSISTGWADSASENKWYQVDLETPSKITRYVLKNAETGYFDQSQNTKSYTFDYSLDGINWETADTVTDNTEDIIYGNLKNAVTARYVRINFTEEGADDVARIQDLEVYGNPVDITKAQLETLVEYVTEASDDYCENDNWNNYTSAMNSAKDLLESNQNNNEAYTNSYYTLTDAIRNLSHKIVIDKAKEANCYETGLTEGSHCSVCEKELVKQEILPKQHDFITITEKPATCTEPGISGGSECSICGKIETGKTTIEPLGHTEVIIPAIAATCSQEGATEGKACSVCKEILVAPTALPKLQHSEVSNDYIAPTCAQEGMDGGTHCAVCGIVIKKPTLIEKLPHTEVADTAVAPTCTKDGLTAGSHCSVCSTVIAAQQTITATGHTCTTIGQTEATYFSFGYTGDEICSVCNEIVTKGTTIEKKTLAKPKVAITAGKKRLKIKYKKVSGASGFQVSYKLGKKTYKKSYASNKTTTKTLKSLKKGKYKVKVRAYVKSGSQVVYSKWTTTKTVKVK